MYIRCGRLCKNGNSCPWEAGKCSLHSLCEQRDMENEDYLSRKLQKGICGETTSTGSRCNRVLGECPFHAPLELRCASCVDADPSRRCKLRKQDGSDYCSNHATFPDFGKVLKAYAEDCRSKGLPFSPTAFKEACYPNAKELPPVNLHALVGQLLCLPAATGMDTTDRGQPRSTSANLGQCVSEQPRSKPPSEAPGMRTARRHRLAIQKEIEAGTLQLDPTMCRADALESELARR